MLSQEGTKKVRLTFEKQKLTIPATGRNLGNLAGISLACVSATFNDDESQLAGLVEDLDLDVRVRVDKTRQPLMR